MGACACIWSVLGRDWRDNGKERTAAPCEAAPCVRACVRACVGEERTDGRWVGAHTRRQRGGLPGRRGTFRDRGRECQQRERGSEECVLTGSGRGPKKTRLPERQNTSQGRLLARVPAFVCVCARARACVRISRWFRSASGKEQGGEQGLSASRTSAAAPPRRRTRRRCRRAGHGPPQVLAGAGCNGEAEAAPDAAAMRTAPPPARKTCRAIAQAPPPTPP